MPCRVTGAVFGLLMLGANTSTALDSPVLLQSFDHTVSGGAWPPLGDAFQIALVHEYRDAINIENARLTDGTWWGNADTGILEFSPGNAGFEAFASYITDGRDDYLFSLSGIGGSGFYESEGPEKGGPGKGVRSHYQ